MAGAGESGVGGGANDCFYRNPLIERCRHGGPGGGGGRGGHVGVTGQMGRQQEVTLWSGTGVSIPIEETSVSG